MKPIIRNISIQHLTVLALLLIITMAIWFEGPLLTIANHQPLQASYKRIFLILTIFILTIIIKWVLTPQNKAMPFLNAKKYSDLNNKLDALKNRFEGAIQFLKKTTIHRHGGFVSLARLPWYLMIGPFNAGKTSLLANATINYTLAKQFKQEKITASDNCDWWATKDLVMVDIPGFYLKEKAGFLWTHFIYLLKKYRGRHGINGIVVTLPLPELIKKQNLPQKKQILLEIKQTILQLNTHFNNQIPIYFIITKCDLLPGFVEFFGELSAEELAQPWGVTLPSLQENENISTLFNQRFNALIKKLNTQLITRLHNERNPNLRPAIKDFPLQLERLKETINNFLKALSIPHLRLHGVYLTSAVQCSEEAKPAQSQLINPGSHQVVQLLRAPSMPSKAFFIRQTLLQGLLSSGDPKPIVYDKKWKYRFTYIFSTVILLGSLILLGSDFQQSIFLTYAIQNDLAQYQLMLQKPGNEQDHFLKILPLLNSLKLRAGIHAKFPHLTHLLSFYSKKSQATANSFYNQALRTLVLPEIKNALEILLKTSSHLESSQLYALLTAYQMLGDPVHFQADYVIKTLQLLNPHLLDKQATDELTEHLIAAAQLSPQLISLNTELLAHTQNHLKNLPKLDLAFVILKNINNNGEIDTTDLIDHSIFATEESDPIPQLFTGATLPNVLINEIPLAASETLQGNWVLGSSEVRFNEATINAFAEELRSHYITAYVEIWENKLKNTRLATPGNLAQLDAMISSITSNTSPLLAFLKKIKENTSFAPILKVSAKLNALNSLLANAHSEQENTLYEIFVSLRKLHFHLENILTATDKGKAAFEAAKNRQQTSAGDPITMIQLLAQQNTQPIKNWLDNLATQSWLAILDEASRYIDNEWQINVATIYHSQIMNHFPMDPDANQEVDMQQFVAFAGKEGTLVKFFEHFLKPFVLDTSNPWQWRSLDNLTLAFSNQVLSQIQQALKIQNLSKYALFSQGRQNPVLQRFRLPDTLIANSEST